MPSNQKKRTVREDVSLASPERDSNLQSSKRFFSDRGNDRATREARALTNAFDTASQLYTDTKFRQNAQGQADATQARGAGQDRDVDEKNAGYNRAWDMLDAEADLNAAMKELPVILEKADAENMTEDRVQAIITDYMKASFAGIDGTSAYGEVMAPGLLELEQNLLGVHRDQQIEKTQVAQRTNITLNAKDRLAAAGGDPLVAGKDGSNWFEYIAKQTNIFFDNDNKKVAYWESIFDAAIRSGRPDLITGSPEKFPDGSFTGLSDSKMAPQIRAAINSATQVQAKQLAERDAAVKQAQDNNITNAQFALYEAVRDGGDTSALIEFMQTMPGIEFSDLSTAKSFGDSQLSTQENRSGDANWMSELYHDLHAGNRGISDVLQSYSYGFLGAGPQAVDELNKMMAIARTVASSGDKKDPEVETWRSQLKQRYNPQLGGMLAKVNPVMQRISLDAQAAYTDLTSNGTPAADAWNTVIEKQDQAVAALGAIEEKEFSRRSQSDFTKQQVPTQLFIDILSGDRPATDLAGVPDHIIESRLGEALDSEELTRAQITEIARRLP